MWVPFCFCQYYLLCVVFSFPCSCSPIVTQNKRQLSTLTSTQAPEHLSLTNLVTWFGHHSSTMPLIWVLCCWIWTKTERHVQICTSLFCLRWCLPPLQVETQENKQQHLKGKRVGWSHMKATGKYEEIQELCFLFLFNQSPLKSWINNNR